MDYLLFITGVLWLTVGVGLFTDQTPRINPRWRGLKGSIHLTTFLVGCCMSFIMAIFFFVFSV